MTEATESKRWGIEQQHDDPTLPPFVITNLNVDRRRRLFHVGYAYEEQDASLIAAAPELLAALLDILDDANSDPIYEDYGPLVRARAAVAKATGKAVTA